MLCYVKDRSRNPHNEKYPLNNVRGFQIERRGNIDAYNSIRDFCAKPGLLLILNQHCKLEGNTGVMRGQTKGVADISSRNRLWNNHYNTGNKVHHAIVTSFYGKIHITIGFYDPRKSWQGISSSLHSFQFPLFRLEYVLVVFFQSCLENPKSFS